MIIRTKNIMGVPIDSASSIITRRYLDSELDEKYVESCLDYYAFPVIFPSTCGPFYAGLCGQAFTTFTIEAWVFNDKYALYFCQGRTLSTTDQFDKSLCYPPKKIDSIEKEIE